MSNETNIPQGDSPARDKFQAAAAAKMENDNNTSVERSLWQGSYSPKAMYGTWVIVAIVTVLTEGAIVGVAMFAPDIEFIWPIIGSGYRCSHVGNRAYQLHLSPIERALRAHGPSDLSTKLYCW